MSGFSFDDSGIELNFGGGGSGDEELARMMSGYDAPSISVATRPQRPVASVLRKKTKKEEVEVTAPKEEEDEQTMIDNNNKRRKTVVMEKAHTRVKEVEKKLIEEKQEEVANEEATKEKIKEKHRSKTMEEDPMQFHAKPKELAKNALKRPREEDGDSSHRRHTVGGSSHIFSRIPFASLHLDSKLVSLLEGDTLTGGLGLKASTRVQSCVVPLLTGDEQRHNVLIKSQTGSGKTLAYLLPMINDFLRIQPPIQRSEGTRALVIAPTRELCGQIADVLAKLTQCCVNMVSGSITGGEKKKSEKARLRKGVVILVGTPGRLLDHLRTTESFTLSRLRWVILDEADRLLDMGFEQSILEILSILRGERLAGLKQPSLERGGKGSGGGGGGAHTLQQKWNQQSAAIAKRCSNTEGIVHLMASATLTRAVKNLAMPVMGGAGFLVVDADKEKVNSVKTSADLLHLEHEEDDAAGEDRNSKVAEEDETEENGKRARKSLQKGETMEAPEQLAQYYMMVTCKWRLAALASFLKLHSHQKVVVFFATCDSVDFHALLFRETIWPIELDPAVEYAGTAESESSSSASSSSSANAAAAAATANMEQVLEPLATTFKGVLGDSCNLYRLHGSVPQKMRQSVFKEFCAAKTGVLFCTDVAARGLDLPRVDWILQFDPPCETTDYVHRVGRTARRGLGGSALLFLLPSEANYTQLLHSHNLYPEPLSLQSLFVDTSVHIPGASKFKNTDEMTAVILQRRFESVVHANRPLLGAARQAFRSFVRAYATHSGDTKGIFRVQSLHLGHVTKSFGLRESPKALRNHDDIIGKIFNGNFSAEALGKIIGTSAQAKKLARDAKYSLSKPKAKAPVVEISAASPADRQKQRLKLVKTQARDKQKLRKMGSSSHLSASGKFRKSDGGYFRKKLRETAKQEFL